MSQPVDGHLCVRLVGASPAPTRYLVDFGTAINSGHFSSFYLKGYQVIGANYVTKPGTDYMYVLESNGLTLCHAVGVGGIPSGNALYLPLDGENFYHDLNDAHLIRATKVPNQIYFSVRTQDGTPAVFTAVVLYFELK